MENANSRNQLTRIAGIRRQRRGTVLLIVVVTVVILALSAYTFTALMQNHYEASRLMTRRIQADLLVDSGVDRVRLFLSDEESTQQERGGVWDNPEEFQGKGVAFAPAFGGIVGRFTVIAPMLDSEGVASGFRYGLVNESAKINLNALPYADTFIPGGARSILMSLPDMTEDIADSILDWLDADTIERENGKESYSNMSPPYECKNGPMDSLEELLLIEGVTPEKLFGLDMNRNGILDDSELNDPMFTGLNPEMMLGWINFVTLYSKESNQNADGLNRVNINSPDLEILYEDLRSALDENWAKYIIFYRQYGPHVPEEGDEIIQSSAPFPIDFEKEAEFQFDQVLDLVDSHCIGNDPDDLNNVVYLKSPVNSFDGGAITAMMTSLTTYEGETIPGRINIMQAPRQVMLGIPGMTEELIDQIIEVREAEPDPTIWDAHRKFETWILVEQRTDLQTMKIMLPFICAGGDVYSAEVVGYFDDGVVTSRASVVLDTTLPVPRILSWRDKSHVEGGFSIETLGTSLKPE